MVQGAISGDFSPSRTVLLHQTNLQTPDIFRNIHRTQCSYTYMTLPYDLAYMTDGLSGLACDTHIGAVNV